MSFRELRKFTEIMRAMNYPRLISLENFGTPNFELIADTLHWLAKRYDSGLDLYPEIATASDRVQFITQMCQLLLQRAHIKLNPRKLYQADAFAVRELLKLANVLYDSAGASAKLMAGKGVEDMSSDGMGGGGRVHDLKAARQLASHITDQGAQLYNLLGKEQDSREERWGVVAHPIELDAVSRAVTSQITGVSEEIASMLENTENMQKDRQNLEAKINKKKAELERNRKRLASLETVRPAFMDEYEKLEEELKGLYAAYVERFRNLEYLQHELAKLREHEEEELDEHNRQLKQLQRKLREEYMSMLRGGEGVEGIPMPAEVDDTDLAPRRHSKKGKKGVDVAAAAAAAPAAAAGSGGERVAYGTMDGGDDDDSIPSDNDADFDDDFDDGMLGDDAHDELDDELDDDF